MNEVNQIQSEIMLNLAFLAVLLVLALLAGIFVLQLARTLRDRR